MYLFADYYFINVCDYDCDDGGDGGDDDDDDDGALLHYCTICTIAPLHYYTWSHPPMPLQKLLM